MALTYGFYNSVEGDRTYDAVQLGQIFDGLITDGIYANYEQGMAVKASDPADSNVIIQPGRAWFNHTWNYNDANFVMPAEAPETLLDRIDALVLDIDTSLAARENKFLWVKGEPASSNPQRPTLINTVTHHQYALCFVHRYPETTTVQAADITNAIGRETPLVAGVLDPIDVSNYIAQWDDEFHTWENNTRIEFNAWQTGEKNAFEAWEAVQEATYNAWLANIQAQQVQDKADWDAWYADLQSQLHDLPEDTAEYLQIEIDDLKGNMSGSIFNISTTNPSLEGKTVTVSNESGTDIVTSQFDEDLRCMIKGYRSVGSITFSSTDGIQTASRTVDIPYFGNYDIPISFWAATLEIQYDEELIGNSVSIKDSNNVLIGTVTLDDSGLAITSVPKPDTYTISTSYEGDVISDTVDVISETTYNVELSIWKAIVNLIGTSDLANTDITIKDSNNQIVKVITLDSSALGIFYAKKPDTYTFEYTFGGETMEVSLNITEETTYNVNFYTYVDITIDVYSAASDTISYTGVDKKTHIITTDSSGHATATFTVRNTGSTFTFTSTVAEDPSDSTEHYKKTIVLDASTTAIYIMPDGEIYYWFGYEPYTITPKAMKASTQTGKTQSPTITRSTYYYTQAQPNQAELYQGGSTNSHAINLADYTTLHAIARRNTSANSNVSVRLGSSASNNFTDLTAAITFTDSDYAYKTADVTDVTSTGYIVTMTSVYNGNSRQIIVKAIWLD